MKSRVLTAIGLIPFVLGAFFCASPWPLIVLALLVAGISLFELTGFYKSFVPIFGALLAVPLLGPKWLENPQSISHGLTLAIWFLVGIAAAWLSVKNTGRSIAPLILSAFWVIVPLLCLVSLHGVGTPTALWNFKTPLLLAVIPLWGGDTAAIFAGKAFGKHLLAPKISPKKTVEGSIANLLACIAVATPLAILIDRPMWLGAACGVIAGTMGQFGDLFESAIKRQVGLKDSGSILPGHGGVLDRIDSILFTAPFVWLLLSFVK